MTCGAFPSRPRNLVRAWNLQSDSYITLKMKEALPKSTEIDRTSTAAVHAFQGLRVHPTIESMTRDPEWSSRAEPRPPSCLE
jgi:hypothetical protein